MGIIKNGLAILAIVYIGSTVIDTSRNKHQITKSKGIIETLRSITLDDILDEIIYDWQSLSIPGGKMPADWSDMPKIKIDPTYTTRSGKKINFNAEEAKRFNKIAAPSEGINHEFSEVMIEQETGFRFDYVHNLLSIVGAAGQTQEMPETFKHYFDWAHLFREREYFSANQTYMDTKDVDPAAYKKFQQARRRWARSLYKKIVEIAGKDRTITIDELIQIHGVFDPEQNSIVCVKYMADLYETLKDEEQVIRSYVGGIGNMYSYEATAYFNEVRQKLENKGLSVTDLMLGRKQDTSTLLYLLSERPIETRTIKLK